MPNARRPLIAGNWKMNGLTKDVSGLASDLASRFSMRHKLPFDILICPPFTLLSQIIELTKKTGLLVGAQDCHTDEKGAHTGDISPQMLADIGCSHVILGHSERRINHGETSELIRAKANNSWTAKLVAIICVGETEEERDAGNTADVVRAQVAESIPDYATMENTIIAYEPIWAIGTGHTATPEEAQKIHALIRNELRDRFASKADAIKILYGGSMKPENASELIAMRDIDGGLIGGASLSANDFWSIGESCKKLLQS